MSNEDIFTRKADNYVLGRRSYSPQAINKILSMLSRGDIIADIGSGTGILSGEFIQHGYETFCVEPNDAMRAVAEKSFSHQMNFHSVAASAENTGLDEHSISLITAASAFHWFDAEKFHAECKRISKKNGTVCILANERIYDNLTQKQHDICNKYCNAYTSLAHGVKKVFRNADVLFKNGYSTEYFDFPMTYTKKEFIMRSLSSSYAPDKGSIYYDRYIFELNALLDEAFSDDTVTIQNRTVMLYGRLN